MAFPAFGIFQKNRCVNVVKESYSKIGDGSLTNDEDQEIFFRCVEDFLELVIQNKIITHDPSRDYFTKEEIVKLFSKKEYFNIDIKRSQEIVSNVFFIKSIVVGGNPNQLSDKEIQSIHKLVPYYRDFYSIIYKSIPTLRNVFNGNGHVPEEQIQKSLDKLSQGFVLLSKSYHRLDVEYSINDFEHLFSYANEKGLLKDQELENYREFYSIWKDNFFASKSTIQNQDWFVFFHHLNNLSSSFVYYKSFTNSKNPLESKTFIKAVRSAKFFILSLIKVKPEVNQGYVQLVSSEDSIPKEDIAKMLRSLNIFSDVKDQDLLSTLKIMPDAKTLVELLKGYEQSYSHLLNGSDLKVGFEQGFINWLDGSFGETYEDNARIVFYPLDSKANYYKLPYELLNYKLISNILLNSYKDQESLSKKDFETIIQNFSPILSTLTKTKYSKEHQEKFSQLFDFSDWFLSEEGKPDQKINHAEFFNLVVHISSSVKNSSYAFNRLKQVCKNLDTVCISENLFSQKDIMSPFSRTQFYIDRFDSQIYINKTKDFLNRKNEKITSQYQLVEFFMLMQVLEVHLAKIDQNNNLNLEEYELFAMADSLAEHINKINPYIANNSQAKSFIVYSFKKGLIPFIKQEDQSFLSVEFFNWHYFDKKTDKFYITRDEMFSMALDFYQLGGR